MRCTVGKMWVALPALLAALVAGCVVPPQPPFAVGLESTPTPAAPATVQPAKRTSSDTLFALRAGETAHVDDAGIDVTFVGVTADERCPLNLLCEIDGPVRLALRVGGGEQAEPDTFDLEVYTNEFGLTDISAPDSMPGARRGAWSISVIALTPYPDARRPNRPLHYQAALVVLPAGAAAQSGSQSTQGQPPPPAPR